MKTSDFDYHLPPELIAQTPLEPRDASRLMVLNRGTSLIEHRKFSELTNYINPGDVLVFNNSRVIPARIFGCIENSTSKAELLLLRKIDKNIWEALARPGKRIKTGIKLNINRPDCSLDKTLSAIVLEQRDNGIRIIQLSDESLIKEFGNTPLPPYIHETLKEPERYQTVYSDVSGSAAAPTAGLHFTAALLDKLDNKGIKSAFVTLHIGLDTFQPVREDDPQNHKIHREYGEITEKSAKIINETKTKNGRIIAVGTSTVRIIEAASDGGRVKPCKQDTDLFITPGYKFKMVDAMITNFHLPKSTLILLVCAFAGRDYIFNAYNVAMQSGYRFYSFGDAMLIL